MLIIKKTELVFYLVLLYFCLPKIDLFMVPGTLTGFRLQDIISACVFLLLLNNTVKIESALLVAFLVLHSFYSSMVWGNFQTVLGLVRFVEYYAIALGLLYIVRNDLFQRFLKLSFLFIGGLSILQFSLLVPNIDPGRGLIRSHEFSGSFGTPAELSYFVVGCLFLSSILYTKPNRYSFLSLAVLLNGVKAVALGFLVVYWSFLKNLSSIIIVPSVVVILFFIYLARENVMLGLQMLDLVAANITSANAGFDDLKSGSDMMKDSSGTLSHRIGKWTNSLSLMYQYPFGLIFGFGIYSQGGAVDGGVVRFIYEFGLVVFIYVVALLSKLSFRFLVFVLSVNLLFDAFMSSVVMPLLLTIFLYLLDKKRYKETR